MIFSYISIYFSSKTNYNVTKCAVVHIHTSFPDYLSCINTKFISLLNMIIQKCS